MQRRSRSSTSVFDVHDREALEPHGTQGHLAGHNDLTFEHALTGVAEVRGIDSAELHAGVGQRLHHGLTGQILDRSLTSHTEGGHAHTDDPHRLGGTTRRHDALSSVIRANP